MLSRLLALIFRRNIKTEFPARLNFYILLYSVEKIIYLLVAIVVYYIFIRIGLTRDDFILTLTAIITLYVGIIIIFAGIKYFRFCLNERKFINPYSYMLISLATRVEIKKLNSCRFLSKLQPDKYIDIKVAAGKAATDLIIHNRKLKRSLNIIVLYYCIVFYILFLAYDYVYFKVTDITFNNFWQALALAFPSLTHIIH